jgi:streptomycin 6-kinase
MVEAARSRWDLEIGPPFEPGGVTSWVAPAKTPAGTDVVLKIVVPHEEAVAEPAGLAAWDGKGAVRLVDHEPDSWALLLERVGPGDLQQAGPAAWLPGMLGVLEQLWSAPAPEAVPSVAAVVAKWPGLMQERPKAEHWDPGVVAQAIEILESWPDEAVDKRLLHGDLHPENVLARVDEWVAIDPKPVVGDPAYDLRQVIRAVVDPDAPVVGQVVDEIATETGIDVDRMLGWTMAIQVDSAIWALPHDPQEAEVDYRLAAACAALLG